MKMYMAIADEHGAHVATTIAGTTCPRCGAPVAPSVPHKCGDQAEIETQESIDMHQQAGAYPD